VGVRVRWGPGCGKVAEVVPERKNPNVEVERKSPNVEVERVSIWVS
jgi:hypothetical protein